MAEDEESALRAAVAGVVGSGVAADGRVKVVVSADGGRDAVTFDPRVMRLPAEELAGLVRDAMRDAHRELFERLAERAAPPAGDLARRVEEMQAAYTDRMKSYERIIAGIEQQLRSENR